MSVAQERLHAEPRQFLLAHAGLLAQHGEHLQPVALGLGQALGGAQGAGIQGGGLPAAGLWACAGGGAYLALASGRGCAATSFEVGEAGFEGIRYGLPK